MRWANYFHIQLLLFLIVILIFGTDFGNIFTLETQVSLIVKIGKALAYAVSLTVFLFLILLGEPILRQRFGLIDFDVKKEIKFFAFMAVYLFIVELIIQFIPTGTADVSRSPTETVHEATALLKWTYTGIAAFFPIRLIYRRIRLRRRIRPIRGPLEKQIGGVIRISGAADCLIRCDEQDSGRIKTTLLAFPGRPAVVLNQSMLDKLNGDEVCAIVLREMGHLVHHTPAKRAAWAIAVNGGIFLAVWVLFEDILRMIATIPSPATGTLIIALFLLACRLIRNAIRQRQEAEADAYAAKNGFGGPLISALKTMEKNHYTAPNPIPVLWLLKETHPPLSRRIEQIEARMNEKEKKEAAGNAG